MIIINNESILRVKCFDVLEDEVESLIETLENELNIVNRFEKRGVGLAAPQIGIAKKAAIIRVDEKLELNLVNANIKEKYDPSVFKQEGCLSFPGISENTIRYQEIYVTDNLVYPHTFVCTGFLAVIVQHEVDHYNSNLFFDRLAPNFDKKNKVAPNDPCICGKINPITGNLFKYKKCCGKKK